MVSEREIDDISEEDINNLDEVETVIYTPNAEDDELECSDEVYDALDYFDLEWPSQTVASFGQNSVIVGTNPERVAPKLQIFDLDKIGKGDFESQALETSVSYNRIRTNSNISCVSDSTFDIYNGSLQKLDSLNFNSVGYGLCCSDNATFFSLSTGVVNIYTDRITDSLQVHSSSIESLSIHDSLLFSCSVDMSAKVTDLRSKEVVFSKVEKAEINSIDTNKDNLFGYGDDNGTIKIVDMRMPNTDIGIFWHKSSISMLMWKDSDIFCSCSDEQICIFDTSLEDEWEYEKYLLFVHQGQKFYKDLCFSKKDNDLVITSSVEGLCMFKPISFAE